MDNHEEEMITEIYVSVFLLFYFQKYIDKHFFVF
jgi:hypothetical protein